MDNVLALQSIEMTGPAPLAEMAGSIPSIACDKPD